MIRVERIKLLNRIKTLESSKRDDFLKRFTDADKLCPSKEGISAMEKLADDVSNLKPTENVSGKKAHVKDTK